MPVVSRAFHHLAGVGPAGHRRPSRQPGARAPARASPFFLLAPPYLGLRLLEVLLRVLSARDELDALVRRGRLAVVDVDNRLERVVAHLGDGLRVPGIDPAVPHAGAALGITVDAQDEDVPLLADLPVAANLLQCRKDGWAVPIGGCEDGAQVAVGLQRVLHAGQGWLGLP